MCKFNFSYLIIALFLLSCGGGEEVNRSVISVISMNDVKSFENVVDNIRYISLKDDNAIFAGRIDKLMSRGDTIYVCDQRESKSLRAYNTKNGEFLFSVGRLGRGPKEYVELSAFTIDDQYFYCVDNASGKILVYNIDNGEFVKKFDNPIYADDIALFEDGKFMFYVDDEPGYGGVFITDKNFEIIDSLYLCTEDNYCQMSTIPAFTESEDKIVFSRYARDTIVVFDKKSYLDPSYYVVDFGKHKTSKEDRLDFDKLNRTKYIMPPVYITDNMIIGDVHIPCDLGVDYWMYGAFVYDKNSKQIYQNGKIEDMLQGKIPLDNKLVLPIMGVVGNEIVSMIDDYDRYQNLVKLGFPATSKHLEKQLKDGEPLLVFYNLKDTTE